jgi:hypothetical protein
MADNQKNNSLSESPVFSKLINTVHKYIIGIGEEQKKDRIIPNGPNMSMEDISLNMKTIRTHWFEGMQYFLMNGDNSESEPFKYLKDIYCFKHTSSLTIEDYKKERLYGAHIYDQLPKDSRSDKEEYATGTYDDMNDRKIGNGLYLDLSRCEAWENAKYECTGVISKEISGEEIKNYIHFEANEKQNADVNLERSLVLTNPKNQELIIHAMREYPDRPVAYIVTRSDNCNIHDYSMTKDSILIFSMLFFGRWCASWNQMRILAAEKLRNFNTHELGSIVFGMNGTRSRLGRMNKKLEIGSRYSEYIRAKSDDFQYICDNVLIAENDFRKHIEMLNIITESQDAKATSLKSRDTMFLPFNEIIFRWHSNFEQKFKFSRKTLRIPIPILNDPSRPAMCSDSRKIELIVYNFLTNADKYGYSGTVVDFDAKLSEDKKYYLFTVTNLGYPLPEDDTGSYNRIFAEGYRGKKESESIGGSGLGLYNAKVIADSDYFNAKIIPKSELVFKYDIAMFYDFAKLKIEDKLKQADIDNILKLSDKYTAIYQTLCDRFDEIYELFRRDNLVYYLSNNIIDNSSVLNKENPLYKPANLFNILSHINRPTYKTTFTLKVQYKRG